jgi:ABC-type multidrug transport system fused ATPase/permease subunit
MVNFSPVLTVSRHAFRTFPLLYAAVALSVVSVVAELAAMASLFPLAELAAGRSMREHSIWDKVAGFFSDHSPVLLFLCFFLILLFIRVGTAGVVALLQARLFRRMIAHFSASAFEAFVKHLSFREIQEKTIGHFITLAGDEANRASQIVFALTRLIPTILLVLLYFGALVFHSLWVGLAVLAFLLLAAVGLIGAFRLSHDLGARQQAESRALNTFFMDALGGLRTVRGFNAEEYAASRYRDMIRQYARTCFGVDAVNILGRTLPALILLLAGLLAIAFWFDERELAAHLSFAMAATIIVLRFLPLVGQGLDTFMKLTADLKAGQNIADVVKIAEKAALEKPSDQAREDLQIQSIEFDRVSFSYASDTPVLREFSAVFEAGKTYAVAGPSGVGKSTVIDLLLAFYPPDAGQIKVNGIQLNELETRRLRSRIGIVEQQARLLSDSIRNNLAFGRAVGEQELQGAVRAAQLEDLVAALPDGYESMVSFQGSNLSGGQRQRISIARALVKPVDVLILDESTAGLDSATRDRIVGTLKEIYRDRILIFLTHDKELVSRVDKVIALSKPEPASAGAD